MIALVVLACLADQPGSCSQTLVTWATTPSEIDCGLAEPDPVTQWAAANPEMQVQGYCCMPMQAQVSAAHTLADARNLPLDPCDVTTRAKAVIWSARNPGLSAIEACSGLILD